MTYPELKIHLDLLSKKEKVKLLKNYEPKFIASNNKFFIVCNDGDCHLFDINGNKCDISEMHEIENNAFYGCTSLTSISIPDSVESIENGAFSHCKSLTSISIPDSVESIENVAFYGCTSLTSISIPDSVESIRNYAFTYCKSLTSVSIPDSVKYIGYGAFYRCNNLKEVVFKGKTIDEVKAMDNYPWELKMSQSSNVVFDLIIKIQII